jgi:hypothetical protein
MTPDEQLARAVLAAASVYDARIREPDPNVIRAWATGLHGLNPQRVLDAVAEHYRTSTDTIMVGHVTALCAVGGDPNRAPAHRSVAAALATTERGPGDALAADRAEPVPAIEGPPPRSGAEALTAAQAWASGRAQCGPAETRAVS